MYLYDIPLPEAINRFYTALEQGGLAGVLGIETVPLSEELIGRVLARPVWARISSPHYNCAAMDGFAVRSKDIENAGPSDPVVLTVPAQAVYVDTGDPLPEWADAVVPLESVELIAGNERQDVHRCEPAEIRRGTKSIRLRAGAPPWSHIRPMGEDIVATQLLLPQGHVLRPVDLGAIAASGHSCVEVARKPTVAIIPTGDELVPVGTAVKAGDIIEFNSLVLAAQVNEWGGSAQRLPILKDNLVELKEKVVQVAGQYDLILINAGSSAGAEDFTARVVSDLGDLLVHGVAIRPGHPVILGMIHRENGKKKTPVIGVPGYPVSAALTGEIFVKPLLGWWLGKQPESTNTIKAELTRKITSPSGDDDYVRVVVGRVGSRLLAAPLSRGAGVITSLVRADGLAIIPRGIQGLPAGAQVDVHLYRPAADLEKAILAIGSHDISLDVLAQVLAQKDRRLVSANVGSIAGLIALKRGECHLAGSHLLDPETGAYNLGAIHEYLAGLPVTVVALVGRSQGLLVQKGNPKKINSLSDLTREDVSFVNRQRGAGTRVLLDYQLERQGIDRSKIKGYAREEYTHLAVAAAVASQRADCGLGIAAAAAALDLDFIPLFEEQYDLVIPSEYYRSPLLQPLLHALTDPDFREVVAQLPGYDVSRLGEVVAEIGA